MFKVLYKSWGYDQTNVDFYLVVEETPKSVKVVELCQARIEEGFMSGRCVPIPEVFTRTPARRVMKRKNEDGSTRYKGLSEWDGTPKYFSTYA